MDPKPILIPFVMVGEGAVGFLTEQHPPAHPCSSPHPLRNDKERNHHGIGGGGGGLVSAQTNPPFLYGCFFPCRTCFRVEEAGPASPDVCPPAPIRLTSSTQPPLQILPPPRGGGSSPSPWPPSRGSAFPVWGCVCGGGAPIPPFALFYSAPPNRTPPNKGSGGH